MSSPEPDDAKPAELTPEARAVIGRARRSFAFSIGLLLVGFIAIAFALVYRATRDEGGVAAMALTDIALPVGAELISASVANGIMTIAYRVSGEQLVRVIDTKTGDIVQELTVLAE
jgi:hypothetical protein